MTRAEPGRVNAHTHLYSGLAALGLPAVAATGDPVRLARHCRELVALGTTHGFRDAAARLTARGLFDQILAAWLCAGFAAGAIAPRGDRLEHGTTTLEHTIAALLAAS